MLLRESVRLKFIKLWPLCVSASVFKKLFSPRSQMGVGADSSTRAFSSNDINTLFERAPIEIYRHPYSHDDPNNTNHVLVAYAWHRYSNAHSLCVSQVFLRGFTAWTQLAVAHRRSPSARWRSNQAALWWYVVATTLPPFSTPFFLVSIRAGSSQAARPQTCRTPA